MKFDRLGAALESGVLLRRYKRFLADVERADGSTLTLHCPNTGAMTGCSTPGSRVWFSQSDNPKRKYPHTLEVIEPLEFVSAVSSDSESADETVKVGINSSKANALVDEAIKAGVIAELIAPQALRREVAVPDEAGRFDFGFTDAAGVSGFVEVKSVTLCLAEGVGAFPDSVSERALRHVQALTRRVAAGQRAVLLFCVQHTGIKRVRCAHEIYPEYAQAVAASAAAGVEVLAYECAVGPAEIAVVGRLPVDLME